MDLRSLRDDQLLADIRALAVKERRSTATFIAYAAEIERRDIVAGQGFQDLFDFCVRDLGLAASTAYKRVQAAKVALLHPEVCDLIEKGRVTTTTLSLVSRQVKRHPALLEQIQGKSKREVEAICAQLGLAPAERPDRSRFVGAPASNPAPSAPGGLFELVSPLPAPGPPASRALASASGTPPPRAPAPAATKPRVEFRFTATADLAGAIGRLRAILWHKFPAGRLEDVLREAIEAYLEKRDPSRERRGSASRQVGEPSRRISAALRRAIWIRDGGRCTFQGAGGLCAETRGLEVDHIKPWALGGRSDDPANLRLLCRAHNQWAARQAFGERAGGARHEEA